MYTHTHTHTPHIINYAHIHDHSSVYPLMSESLVVLMQRTPRQLDHLISGGLQKVHTYTHTLNTHTHTHMHTDL